MMWDNKDMFKLDQKFRINFVDPADMKIPSEGEN
jgi:hypothetical protein